MKPKKPVKRQPVYGYVRVYNFTMFHTREELISLIEWLRLETKKSKPIVQAEKQAWLMEQSRAGLTELVRRNNEARKCIERAL